MSRELNSIRIRSNRNKPISDVRTAKSKRESNGMKTTERSKVVAKIKAFRDDFLNDKGKVQKIIVEKEKNTKAEEKR